jgi:hypothetical protein
MDTAPTIEVEVKDFGLRIYALRKAGSDKRYLRVTNFILPSAGAFGGGTGNDGYSVNWHVPIDDTQHWRYAFQFSRTKPLDRERWWGRGPDRKPDYKSTRDKSNRYLQDREEMKTKTYTGLGYNFSDQDRCVIERAGLIQDRGQENLATSDKAIVAARQLLLKGIKDVQEGSEPPHVVRDPKLNRFSQLVVIGEVIPSSASSKEHAHKAESEVRVSMATEGTN